MYQVSLFLIFNIFVEIKSYLNTMNVKIESSWQQRLQEEFDKPYFEKLVNFVKNEYGKAHILPPGHQIFHVFNSCPFQNVKVVILGQDPYPNPGQYYGICFPYRTVSLFQVHFPTFLKRYIRI